MNAPREPVAVRLPEPVGRRARFGPFASGQDALKFAAVAGVGALCAEATNPLLWVPFLAAAALVGLARVDGRPLDAHAAEYVGWRVRRERRAGARRGERAAPACVGAVASGPDGRRVAVIETEGIPIGFLPRREAEALFDGYRALLRAHDHGLVVVADVVPVAAPAFLPPEAPPGTPEEEAARAGYRELVALLLARRHRRRVRLLTWADPGAPGGLAALEGRVQALFGGLLGLGIPARRLEGVELARALSEWRGTDGPA